MLVKRAIALRHAYPVLRRGEFERYYASDDVCTFGRRLPDAAAVVAFNAGQEARTINIDTGDLLSDGFAEDVWNGGTVRVSNGIVRHVNLAPRSAAVLVMRR